RHGAHHVAHKFISTVLPFRSARVIDVPSGALKARSRSNCCGFDTIIAATSPCAAASTAASTASLAVQLLSLAAISGSLLPDGPPITYTPSAPAIMPATTAATIRRPVGR